MRKFSPYGYVCFSHFFFLCFIIKYQIDNDEPSRIVCTLPDSLILQSFGNSMVKGHSINVSEGCESKLVTTCDPQILDLEIRVDFYQNDFSSTNVSINYEGATVIIHNDFSIETAIPLNGKMTNFSSANMALVSLSEIMLVITRNLSGLTLSSDSDSLPVAGLCGGMDGMLYFPDCNTTVGAGESLELFKQSYKVEPSEQMLRGERMACGKCLCVPLFT